MIKRPTSQMGRFIYLQKSNEMYLLNRVQQFYRHTQPPYTESEKVS